MGWTTDDLLTRARIYGSEPAAVDGGISDADSLQLADDDLQSYVYPKVLLVHEEYYVYSDDQTIVSGTDGYWISKHAHAGRLRDVLYVPTSGYPQSLPLIDPDELGARYSFNQGGPPQGFYLQGSRVVLWPTPDSAYGTLRLKILWRPGTLVATSAAARITVIGAADSGGAGYRRFTCATVPTSVTTSVTLDHVRALNAFETQHADMAVHARTTGASGTIDIAETAFTAANIAVGDYFCLAGQSCIPQIPDALHVWLARRLACAMLEQRRDRSALADCQAKADEIETQLADLLKPRVEGEPRVITTANSPFRAGMRSGYRYGAYR